MANLFSKIDIEGNNLSQFTSTSTGTGYALASASGAAKNGTYGARATATSTSDTGNAAKGVKTFTSTPTNLTVVDGEFRFSSWTGSGYNVIGSKSLLMLNASGAGRVAWLAVRGTRMVELCYRNTAFSDTASGLTLTMTLNTWYRLRIVHNKSTGALTFKYSTDGGSTWTTVGTVASGVRTDNIDEVHAGVVHVNNWEQAQYTVDFDDLEGWDVEPASGTPPNAPTLDSASTGNAQVALSWTAPGTGQAPTGYKVRRGTSAGVYTTTVDVGLVTSYTVTGLTNGTTYYFDVLAYNLAGDGGDSNELSATPAAGPPPDTPVLTSLVPGNTQLTVGWGAAANASTYTVKYGTAAGVYGTTVTGITGTSHVITGLTNGTRYYVVVMAVNGNGNSSNSNELNAVPTAASLIKTKYNDMAVGDVVFLEKLFTLEVLSVLQHSSPDAGKVYKSVTVNGQPGYEFEVSRDVDGTGKNDWLAGDGYVNTGSPGTGFIDQYSYSSVLARPFEFIAVDGTLVDSFSVDFTLLTGLNSVLALGMSNVKFDSAFITLKTPAVYAAATLVYEYWNGSAWTTLAATVAEVNSSNGAISPVDWKTAGNLSITFTPPANWAKTTIAAQSAYWIRVRVTAATTWTQNPKQGGGKWVTRGKRQYGPSIAMWRRMSTTWNDLREGGVMGNLQGFYDYGAPTMGAAFGDPGGVWVSFDAARGIRFMNVNSPIVSIDTSGAFLFRGPASASVNVGALRWNPATYVFEGGYYAPAAGPAYGAFTQQWATDAASGEIVAAAGLMKIGAQGLRITADYSYGNTRAIRWVSGANDLAKIWTLQQSATRGDLYLESSSGGEVNIGSGYLVVQRSVGQITANVKTVVPSLVSGDGYVSQYGGGGFGRLQRVFTPTNTTWVDESALLLHAGNWNGSSYASGGYSVIGFHEAGIRVDFIRVGAGVITLGYDGGFGSARVEAPGGISTAVNMVPQRISSADDFGAVITPIERACTLKQWTINLYVPTTNNGSNYWTFTLKRLDTNGTVDSFNTSALPASTWTRIARTPNAAITTGMAGLYVDITKTGSPGTLQSAQSLYLL